MILKNHEIAELLRSDYWKEEDPLVVTPMPDVETLRRRGSASIDLRLGTWFVTTKARRHSLLKISEEGDDHPTEQAITNKYYVPFGREFILHPRSFVLAVTLEWIRIPSTLCGYLTGKSSWGRRGLLIETASGVHPGFTGCLTLELTNVGDIPFAIMPGTKICQLFIHRTSGDARHKDQSLFMGQRQPSLGKIELDDFARRLISGI